MCKHHRLPHHRHGGAEQSFLSTAMVPSMLKFMPQTGYYNAMAGPRICTSFIVSDQKRRDAVPALSWLRSTVSETPDKASFN